MWIRNNAYYIAYDVFLPKNKVIHGSGTFICKGKPTLDKWIKEIEAINFNNRISSEAIQVISCIPVDEDFIK